MAYRIEYSPDALDHLRSLEAPQQRLVIDSVKEQLSHQPHVEIRNRKPMRPNPVAPWELRIGDLRVYYELDDGPDARVLVRAVGIKRRNRIYIGGEIIEL